MIGISHLFLAMDCSGSVFSILALVYSDNMDALNLANYIAIACFDLGILFLYYFFEWYQTSRFNTRKEEDVETVNNASDNNNNFKETIQSPYDCEDVHNTKSLA